MGEKQFNYIFGPVQSRRLGLSLGIDISPYKTCTLNCLYCECGPTTKLTIKRHSFIKSEVVIRELRDYLSKISNLDVITFSGSGEPTLNKEIGKIIAYIKTNYDYPVCVLTNGTLLYRPDVQQDIIKADIVIPSLDSAREDTFQKINRPHNRLKLDKIINGIRDFKKIFQGKLFLEIFFIPGLNDTDQDISALKQAITKIKPDKIQINTLDRPGAVSWVKPENHKKLTQIYNEFKKILPTEILSRNIKTSTKTKTKIRTPRSIRGKLLSIITRRPSTLMDLSMATGLEPAEISPHIKELLKTKQITKYPINKDIFYKRNLSNITIH